MAHAAGKTVYIVPAWSDQAGQCRIVAAEGKISDAAASYRHNPAAWSSVGHMNSRGKLVSLTRELQEAGLFQEMRDCEPLMAGTQFFVEFQADKESESARPVNANRPRG